MLLRFVSKKRRAIGKEASIDIIGKPVTPSTDTSKYAVASATLHLLLVGLLIHHGTSWIAPISLPGTKNGSNLTLTYLPGRAPAQTSTPNLKAAPKLAESTSRLSVPAPKLKDSSASPNSVSPASPQPNSSAGADSLGSGNIDIARLSYFPTPKPDLSSLPPGTKGDVIIDIVIDTNGKISDLKMTSGLGHGVDEVVIATVQQWTFHPATKNGQPIASEQELHFHYEKG
jgi:protein TonB